MLDAFEEEDSQRVIRAYENCISLHIHTSEEGKWKNKFFQKEPSIKRCKVLLNPEDKLEMEPNLTSFVNYLDNFLEPTPLEELYEPSDVVGNIRFSRPTLYVFPGGQGDCALFGINGFNMLVDGGFSRKACFWDFVKHLDRLDAVLLTRFTSSNMNGLSSVLARKAISQIYPQVGHFFSNVINSKKSPDGDKDKDSLAIDILEEGGKLCGNMHTLRLKPATCYRDNSLEPINLYHKVGHGSLNMYVINPSKDSKEVKEFLDHWNSSMSTFTSKKMGVPFNGKEIGIPLPNLVSICALLVWHPADPLDTVTRILFPGSCPQSKIFEGLEKLKHLEELKQSVVLMKSLMPTKTIDALIEDVKPTKNIISNKQIRQEKKAAMKQETKKEVLAKGLNDAEKDKNNKLELKLDKVTSKPTTKTEDNRFSSKEDKPLQKNKSKERKVKSHTKSESKSSEHDTQSVKSKISKKIKASPHGTPTKTKKEASNKKMAEARNQAVKAASEEKKKKSENKQTNGTDTKSGMKPVKRREIKNKAKSATDAKSKTESKVGDQMISQEKPFMNGTLETTAVITEMTADKISVELTTVEKSDDLKVEDDSLEENAYRELLKEKIEQEDTPKDSLEVDIDGKVKTDSIVPDTFDIEQEVEKYILEADSVEKERGEEEQIDEVVSRAGP